MEYWAYVADNHSVENGLHARFRSSRHNKNEEFFTCSIPAAIDAVQETARSGLKENINYKCPEKIRQPELERERSERPKKASGKVKA